MSQSLGALENSYGEGPEPLTKCVFNESLAPPLSGARGINLLSLLVSHRSAVLVVVVVVVVGGWGAKGIGLSVRPSASHTFVVSAHFWANCSVDWSQTLQIHSFWYSPDLIDFWSHSDEFPPFPGL